MYVFLTHGKVWWALLLPPSTAVPGQHPLPVEWEYCEGLEGGAALAPYGTFPILSKHSSLLRWIPPLV